MACLGECTASAFSEMLFIHWRYGMMLCRLIFYLCIISVLALLEKNDVVHGANRPARFPQVGGLRRGKANLA
jgi:hypothetical protein